jgi:hypothetical protein
MLAGETVFFECNQWLSGSKGDGLAERTLVASSANPRDRLAAYRLELHTSDMRAAGSSANVWVQLHGAGGASSGVQQLQVPLLCMRSVNCVSACSMFNGGGVPWGPGMQQALPNPKLPGCPSNLQARPPLAI